MFVNNFSGNIVALSPTAASSSVVHTYAFWLSSKCGEAGKEDGCSEGPSLCLPASRKCAHTPGTPGTLTGCNVLGAL